MRLSCLLPLVLAGCWFNPMLYQSSQAPRVAVPESGCIQAVYHRSRHRSRYYYSLEELRKNGDIVVDRSGPDLLQGLREVTRDDAEAHALAGTASREQRAATGLLITGSSLAALGAPILGLSSIPSGGRECCSAAGWAAWGAAVGLGVGAIIFVEPLMGRAEVHFRASIEAYNARAQRAGCTERPAQEEVRQSTRRILDLADEIERRSGPAATP